MLLFCMVSMLSVFVHAAELQVTYQIGRTEKTGSEVTGSLKSLNLSEATFFFCHGGRQDGALQYVPVL